MLLRVLMVVKFILVQQQINLQTINDVAVDGTVK